MPLGPPNRQPEIGPRRGLWYLLLVAGVFVLALIGYLGFVAYRRLELPPAVGAGLFLLASVAGVAAFFSPCSFPLLATLLSRAVGERSAKRTDALRYAMALSTGVALFLLLTGGVIALGGGALLREVTFTSQAGRALRVAVGALLVLLGLAQAGVVRLPFDRLADLVLPLHRVQVRLRGRRPTLAFGLYGFIYVLAGFG